MISNQRFEVVTRKRAFLNLKSTICNLKLSRFRPPHPDELLVLTRLDLTKAGPASDIPPTGPALSISQCKGDVASDESCGVFQKRPILRPNKD
jgi:hypothetical protein